MDKWKQCKFCRKPFICLGGNPLCVNCVDMLDKAFLEVREYIYNHDGNLGIKQISEDTGISEKVIVYLLKDGRLESKNVEGSFLSCEACGRSIRSGKLCAKCLDCAESSLPAPVHKDDKFGEASVKDGTKMHVDHRRGG